MSNYLLHEQSALTYIFPAMLHFPILSSSKALDFLQQDMAQNRPQFQCGYFGCNKTFTRRTGARRHETTVHGDKKYCCSEPDCNYRGGKRRHDFKKHMQNKHPGYDGM